MHIEPSIIVALVLGIAVWLFMRWRSPRPKYEPMAIDLDDPLMVDALAKAKDGMAQFLRLARTNKDSALVKLRFVSSSNQVEYLWAEVLEIISDQEIGVRLLTPPVTHSGELDRLYRCDTEDIEDWQVRDDKGKLYGGFSQRAMFAIARRDGIKLPRDLLKNEYEYRDV
ncbi:MAG: DUF2314 domain-containing protein [Candidatus Accumulibacter sp.]|jgi:uncharacterized protein YegJ (DUF2314 family)|nr:DUF2314 domain-containing protein [Accumulibacter sp.]